MVAIFLRLNYIDVPGFSEKSEPFMNYICEGQLIFFPRKCNFRFTDSSVLYNVFFMFIKWKGQYPGAEISKFRLPMFPYHNAKHHQIYNLIG